MAMARCMGCCIIIAHHSHAATHHTTLHHTSTHHTHHPALHHFFGRIGLGHHAAHMSVLLAQGQ